VVELEQKYLQRWQDTSTGRGFTEEGRQILHTTFGSVLTHTALKDELLQVLREHPDTYRDVLDEHFSKHLMALRAGM
ncbi:MAG: tagaturonate epimerase, partial [Humisphaera sp.]|nr:tagaturonate epimerase [Humisphaera sp.]